MTSEEKRHQLERLDAWLRRLKERDPICFNLLTAGLGVVFFGFVWAICGLFER